MKNKTSNPSAFNGAMTLRDYFAAKVLVGLCSDMSFNPDDVDDFAKVAYKIADSMLKEREKA